MPDARDNLKREEWTGRHYTKEINWNSSQQNKDNKNRSEKIRNVG